jgi:uncharacterized membrane protein (UPF0127 family)
MKLELPSLKRFSFLLASLLILTTIRPLQAQEQTEETKVVFKKRHLSIGSKKLLVEIADDEAKRERGLMFRKKLDEKAGMLFIFPTERPVSFWMKNTLIPLSIGYFDSEHVLKKILEMSPAVLGEVDPMTYPSGSPVMYALEMPPKWFQQNKIIPGMKFKLSVQ